MFNSGYYDPLDLYPARGWVSTRQGPNSFGCVRDCHVVAPRPFSVDFGPFLLRQLVHTFLMERRNSLQCESGDWCSCRVPPPTWRMVHGMRGHRTPQA